MKAKILKYSLFSLLISICSFDLGLLASMLAPFDPVSNSQPFGRAASALTPAPRSLLSFFFSCRSMLPPGWVSRRFPSDARHADDASGGYIPRRALPHWLRLHAALLLTRRPLRGLRRLRRPPLRVEHHDRTV